MNTSEHEPTERDAALRSLLVETVSSTPVRRRSRWHVGTIAGAVACVLVGAGGAITAAASPDRASVTAQANARIVVQNAESDYDKVVGDPIGLAGSDSRTVSVGAAPAGAQQFVGRFSCTGGGTLSVRDWHGSEVPIRCTSEYGVDVTGTPAQVRGTTIRITTSGTANWVLSMGWLKSPPMPKPSDAQVAAVSDGIVTRSEYVDAFNRFQGCMDTRGDSIGTTPESSLFFTYAATNDYDMDWCSALEYDDVYGKWVDEHPRPSSADPASWGDQEYDPATDPKYAG
jgi:hypothetical protein